MRIFLWGYMGCGKSYIGKQLANDLCYLFVDLDKYIEEKEQTEIATIFEEKGEETFRLLEKKYLHQISQLEKVVIAVGGGTPCFFDNIAQMNSCGTTIFLDLPLRSLHKRLQNCKHRPLLRGKTAEQLKDFITTQHNERLPYYTQAQHRIVGDNIRSKDLLPMFPNNC